MKRSSFNTVEKMLARRVQKVESGCWVWQGHLIYGYGYTSIGHKTYRAHRVIYEALKGPIAEGMQLDHLCRNRACVNPDHLEPVTAKENQVRSPISPATLNSQKETCGKGHPLSGLNLYIDPSGWRQCRTCRREAGRRSKEARRAPNSF